MVLFMFGEGKFEQSKLSSPCLLLLAILILSVLEIAVCVAFVPWLLSALSLSMNKNSSQRWLTSAVVVAFRIDLTIDVHTQYITLHSTAFLS